MLEMCIRDRILTAASWLQRLKLEADEHNTMIAAGAQNALATILSSLFEAGDRIAVDTYTSVSYTHLDVYKRKPWDFLCS